VLPKNVFIPAFKKDREYDTEKKKIELFEQTKIENKKAELEEATLQKTKIGVEKIKKEKEMEAIDPKRLWRDEFEEFRRDPFSNQFTYIVDSLYKYSGRIHTNTDHGIFKIPQKILMYAHSHDLIQLNKQQQTIELTEKGKFFVRNYLTDKNMQAVG